MILRQKKINIPITNSISQLIRVLRPKNSIYQSQIQSNNQLGSKFLNLNLQFYKIRK